MLDMYTFGGPYTVYLLYIQNLYSMNVDSWGNCSVIR